MKTNETSCIFAKKGKIYCWAIRERYFLWDMQKMGSDYAVYEYWMYQGFYYLRNIEFDFIGIKGLRVGMGKLVTCYVCRSVQTILMRGN